MVIRTQPAMQVLYSSHQTTVKELGNFVGKAPVAIYQEISQLGLLPAGPQYWMYYGLDGKPDTVFTLEIAIPVQGQRAATGLKYKDIPAFKCLVHQHNDAWAKLPETMVNLCSILRKTG